MVERHKTRTLRYVRHMRVRGSTYGVALKARARAIMAARGMAYGEICQRKAVRIRAHKPALMAKERKMVRQRAAPKRARGSARGTAARRARALRQVQCCQRERARASCSRCGMRDDMHAACRGKRINQQRRKGQESRARFDNGASALNAAYAKMMQRSRVEHKAR